MDLVARISPPDSFGFWGVLAQDFRCRYVVFEFKNYKNKISQNQIYSTEKYLYPNALRTLAIVVARNGADDGAKRAVQAALRDAGKILLILDKENLSELLLASDEAEGKDKVKNVDAIMYRHLDRLLTTLSP